jgi:putative restriction endonuclease
MKRNNWTREETIVAFNVYCRIPFKASSKSNPLIIKYSQILGRSPSALNMKVGNFGRLDPELKKQGIVGLAHGSKMEDEVWEEFNGNWEKLAFESELLISKFANKSIELASEIETDDLKAGIDIEAIVKQRVNQSFFRRTVLSSYNYKCCITGLSIPDFLIASHIIPWSKNTEQRLNPRNGLCLNSIHDKAFDRGFITITPEFIVKVSKSFCDFKKERAVQEFFIKYENLNIHLPNRFLPEKDFLDFHYNNIFMK